jgi:hypothetical protein
MKTLSAILALCAAAVLTLPLQAAAADKAGCEKSADEKKLHGAARTSHLKKCMGEGGGAAACEAKAVSKDGKPLAGAAKSSFMKKCEAEASK